MESIKLDIIDHMPSIVTIIIGVCLFLYLMFQTVVKKFLEESVSQGFQTKLSQLELMHKHKFSLADEERKAIYDVSSTTTKALTFLSFLVTLDDYDRPENEIYEELIEVFTSMAVVWEKLAVLRLDFLNHSYLLKQLTEHLNEMAPITASYRNNLMTSEEMKATLRTIISQIEVNVLSKLRVVLNGYLLEMSK